MLASVRVLFTPLAPHDLDFLFRYLSGINRVSRLTHARRGSAAVEPLAVDNNFLDGSGGRRLAAPAREVFQEEASGRDLREVRPEQGLPR